MLLGIEVHAQFDFRKGYLIKNTNDTISGWIDYRRNNVNSKKCVFKQNIEDKSRIFSPKEIKAYRFIDGKYYVSKKLDVDGKQSQLFLEYLINGIVDIYYYSDEEGENYLADQGEGNLIRLKNEERELIRNRKTFVGESKEYRRMLKVIFKESPTIVKRVNSLDLNHKSIIEIAHDYHNEVCLDQKCIIYEMKLSKTSRRFGMLFGMNYTSVNDKENLLDKFSYLKDGALEDALSPNIGFFYKTNLPMINDKIHLQYSASFSFLKLAGTHMRQESLYHFKLINRITLKRTLFHNNLLFKYEFPQGVIRPTLQFGGLVNYAISTKYERSYELRNTNDIITDTDRFTKSPFSKLYAGFIFGLGFNTTVFNGRTIFFDLNYSTSNLLDKFEGLKSNVLTLNLGIPIGKKE